MDQTFLLSGSPPVKLWQRLLGHMALLEHFVHLGWTQMHPLQWQLRAQWSQFAGDPLHLVPAPWECQEVVQWRLQEERCLQGVLLQLPTPSLLLYTDSCHKNQSASGVWTSEKMGMHINVLEMMAVILALHAFLSVLAGELVIMSDNVTVVAKLAKQGEPCFAPCATWQQRFICRRSITISTSLLDASRERKTSWWINRAAWTRFFPRSGLFFLGCLRRYVAFCVIPWRISSPR